MAKRKNARPNAIRTSPIEATFAKIGSGIGMTSANGPRWRAKLESRVAGRIVWMAGETSAGVKPAAVRLGVQIGIRPPFTARTTAFEATPTKAIDMPGRFRLAHRPRSRIAEAPTRRTGWTSRAGSKPRVRRASAP